MALQCFTLAQSLGGIESLICHPGTMTHASMDAAAQKAAGMGPTLIRLSVGIEDGRDLLADLAQAFAAVQQAMKADGVTPVATSTAAVTTTAQAVTTSNKTAADAQSQQEFRLNPALAAFW